MKPIRSFLAVTTLCAASGITGIVGYNMVQNVQFAHAAQQVDATRQQLHQAEDLSTVFRDISKVVSPSVVKIDVEKKVEGFHSANPFQQDPFFQRFFGPNGPNGMNPGGQGGQGDNDENGNGNDVQMGTGSGVIMDTEGDKAYIVTNNHVAGGAAVLTVTLADGRKIDKDNCKVVGTDPKTDLAVVEITADHVIAAKWGDSDQIEQGDWVLAFGAPLGYVGSMTHGIISALHRTGVENVEGGGYENFLQTDAPINPGNSGGPLVNLHGEVIGINTAIASQSGGFQGIGFAIPSNMVQNIYTEIKTKGKVTRGWLGVGIENVSDYRDVARSYHYDADDGVLVRQVFRNTPASGILHHGDVITEANGKKVETRDELRAEIAKTAPGDQVKLKVFRDNKFINVNIKIGEQPENLSLNSLESPHNGMQKDNGQANVNNLGLQLGDLTDERAQRLGLQDVQGALVLNVQQDSPAARAGLTPGAVITEIGGTNVTSADEAQNALSKADLTKGVRLYVTLRDGSQQFLVIRTGHDE